MKTTTKRATRRIFLAAVVALATSSAWADTMQINSVQEKDTDWSYSGDISIGAADNARGILTNNYSGAVAVYGYFYLSHGANSYGEYVQNAGDVTVANTTYIGHNSSSEGLVVINAGTFGNSGKNIVVGFNGKGALRVNTGGTVSCNALYICDRSGSTGEVDINGGSMIAGHDIYLPNNSNTAPSLTVRGGGHLTGNRYFCFRKGVLTVENGTIEVPNNDFELGQHDAVTLNLNEGGVVGVQKIIRKANTNTVMFNGGELKALNNCNDLITSDANVIVKVGAKGGTINSNSRTVTFKRPIVPDGANDGGMKFIGGGTITFDAVPTYVGGTTVELGTKLVASDSTAKDAILGNGLVVDGRLKLASGSFDLFKCSGLVSADLDKITFVNCGEGTNAVFDDDDSPTKIVVKFVVPACVGTSPVKVWSGKTLDEIAYGSTFTARFAGASNSDTRCVPNSSTGYYEEMLCNDGGSVTNIIVEFQTQHDSYVRCVVVSFENGVDGIYATGLSARYASGTVGNYEFYRADGLHGNSITLAETPTANYYTVFDLRVDTPPTKVWTLDSDDTTWSTLRGDETLSSDAVVVIKANGDYTFVVDEDVNVERIMFVNGTGLTMGVASGNTVAVDSIGGCVTNILNNGTLVKTGEGTEAWPFDNASTGTTIVSNGTLKVTSKTGSGRAHTVRVTGGATFDVNDTPLTLSVILEEGANFINTGSDLGYKNAQTIQLTLEGDAYVGGNTFGLVAPSYGATSLNLGSHTLVIDKDDKEFSLANTTIVGAGTISVTSGRLATRERDSSGTDCTISIGASGLFENNKHFTVSNFVNNGTIAYASGWGRGELEVTGRFESKTASYPKLTLTGATVKPAADGVVTVLETFAASGTVTIDASEISAATLREGNVPVLTVPASFNTSSATWTVSGEPISVTRTKWVDNGDDTKTLYLARSAGLTVIFY